MENLKQYTTKLEVERILESSNLPTYAKYMIAREVATNLEKKYFEDVNAEYAQSQEKINNNPSEINETEVDSLTE